MEVIETELIPEQNKRDSRGRRIAKEEERERLIERYEASGMTQKAFCRREGINYHTFVAWLGRRKLEKKERVEGSGFEEFILPINQQSSVGVLEIRLPGGEVLCGSDAGELAKLVKLLRG